MARTGKEQYVVGALPLLANALSSFGDSLVDDLTFRQFYLLSMIERMGRADKSIVRIAEFCGSTRQNIRRMVEALSEKGYVSLAPSRLDGRALSVELTRRAKLMLDRQRPHVEDEVADLLDSFSDAELDALVAGLGQLASALDDRME